MHMNARFWRIPALLLITAMLSVACGTGQKETNGGGGGPTGRVVKIGVIAPLSGSLSALGVGIRNSVDLAVKQANAANKIPGWRIEMDAQDDTAKADIGAQVASKLASDPSVAGVVGTLNSSVALQVQPILQRAGIVMVSPANTGVELTQGTDPNNKKRPFANYFRVCTTDAVQGPFGAEYATKDLGARSIATVHDKKTYGQGLVSEFENQATRNGARVVAEETVNPGDKDFSAVLSKIKPLNPDLIYYGGEYPEASLLSSQAEQQGIRAPLMGGDGIYDNTYIQTAKQGAEGDLATSVGAPTEQLASARNFVDAYNRGGYRDPFSAYGAYAFDDANVIIESMAKVLAGKTMIDDQVRRSIIDQVQDTSLDGVTGKIAFDQFGDTTTKVLTVYKVEGGAWKPVKTGEFR